ncbi:MAG: glycerophosphodiester phosphodiesterase family protein [Clostridia bacterium]|nr:glycerophosphodiester phosphodiesterase family protein [Clostridia bacterium]
MLPYRNEIAVAAHRGNSRYFPENTMAAYCSAIALEPDMIEMDVHMTQDGVLVCMHDHTVDRTTDGTGLVREKTLAQVRELDAGSWKDERFAGEKVPTFEEFLEMMKAYPQIMINVELKDYPAHSGEFAYEAAKKAIGMLRSFDMLSRSTINTWSGELNEWLNETYGDEIMIHAYFPQTLMGLHQKRFVLDYAYCVCLFGDGDRPVVAKKHFDMVKAYGVEPWVYYKEEHPEEYDAAIENGARLFTANDPAWAIGYLRQKGLHK